MEEKYAYYYNLIVNKPLFKTNKEWVKQNEIVEECEELFKNLLFSNVAIRRSTIIVFYILDNIQIYGIANEPINFQIKLIESKLLFLCEYKSNKVQSQRIESELIIINNIFLDKGEQKEYFKYKISNDYENQWSRDTSLLDISRKTNEKFLYQITDIDKDTSLVSLIIILNNIDETTPKSIFFTAKALRRKVVNCLKSNLCDFAVKLKKLTFKSDLFY